MYSTLLSTQEFIARKQHRDDGHDILRSAYLSYVDIYGRENPGISHISQECFKQVKAAYIHSISMGQDRILPGQKYIRQCSVQDGDFYMWKTRKENFELIKSLDLWPEE